MATEGHTFEQWLHEARISPARLSDQQRAVLHAAFQFLQQGEGGYSTSRIASHFLLHCGLGLDIAQVARLVGISPRSAFRHRDLSAKQVGQQIHDHFRGRRYGKLLPRHAGPIAEFLFTHPQATRDELLDFIARTWQFRVSKVALYGSSSRNTDWTTPPWRRSGRPPPARKSDGGSSKWSMLLPRAPWCRGSRIIFFRSHGARRGLPPLAAGDRLAGRGP